MYSSFPPISSSLLLSVILRLNEAPLPQLIQTACNFLTLSHLGINSQISPNGRCLKSPSSPATITIFPPFAMSVHTLTRSGKNCPSSIPITSYFTVLRMIEDNFRVFIKSIFGSLLTLLCVSMSEVLVSLTDLINKHFFFARKKFVILLISSVVFPLNMHPITSSICPCILFFCNIVNGGRLSCENFSSATTFRPQKKMDCGNFRILIFLITVLNNLRGRMMTNKINFRTRKKNPAWINQL